MYLVNDFNNTKCIIANIDVVIEILKIVKIPFIMNEQSNYAQDKLIILNDYENNTYVTLQIINDNTVMDTLQQIYNLTNKKIVNYKIKPVTHLSYNSYNYGGNIISTPIYLNKSYIIYCNYLDDTIIKHLLKTKQSLLNLKCSFVNNNCRHIDELICFIPNKKVESGFKIWVYDPVISLSENYLSTLIITEAEYKQEINDIYSKLMTYEIKNLLKLKKNNITKNDICIKNDIYNLNEFSDKDKIIYLTFVYLIKLNNFKDLFLNNLHNYKMNNICSLSIYIYNKLDIEFLSININKHLNIYHAFHLFHIVDYIIEKLYKAIILNMKYINNDIFINKLYFGDTEEEILKYYSNLFLKEQLNNLEILATNIFNKKYIDCKEQFELIPLHIKIQRNNSFVITNPPIMNRLLINYNNSSYIFFSDNNNKTNYNILLNKNILSDLDDSNIKYCFINIHNYYYTSGDGGGIHCLVKQVF